jgi:hypothetical protein
LQKRDIPKLFLKTSKLQLFQNQKDFERDLLKLTVKIMNIHSKENKEQCLCSSQGRDLLFKGRSLVEWTSRLYDLCVEERLNAIDAISTFVKHSSDLLPFRDIITLLQDDNDEVRNEAGNLLLMVPSLCASYKYSIEIGLLEGKLSNRLGEQLNNHLIAQKNSQASLKSLDEILEDNFVITWAIVAKAIATAIVSWATQRVLDHFFRNGVDVSKELEIASYEFRRIINVALNENELRRYKAETSSLMDDFRVYISNTERQKSQLDLILNKSSSVVRGTQSLDISSIGSFSIAANLRLLSYQELVRYFGGDINNLKSEKDEYSNYILSRIPRLQAHLNERFSGNQCTEIEGNPYGGNCATYWTLDGEKQYVGGAGEQCMIFIPPGALGSRCEPFMDPRPGDCVTDICNDHLFVKRKQLQDDLNNEITALSEIVNIWKNMPDHP